MGAAYPFIVDFHEGGFKHVVDVLAILNQLEEIQKRAEDETMAWILGIRFANELKIRL